ncbi:MAG TPA: nitroreductase/quinone reductase family protein [Candidatus Dormibacteraeota bacterium]|jgi:deazaflavin-dependent oxidoreductase (nitroreductase family)|nr:nitroreductase/quinone reductase family protein [Candidatus Dormibacteraeota bacterium]
MTTRIDRKETSAVPRVPFYIPLFNHAVRAFLRLGAPIGNVGLLSVPGRKTGKIRRNPVGFFQYNGRRYLFSTFGEVNWVRNLRSAKYVTVRKGLRTRNAIAVELNLSDAAEILREVIAPAFLGLGGKIFGSHFPLKPDSPRNDFIEEAKRHPVFELRDVKSGALS